MKVGIFIKNYAVGKRFDKSGVPNKSGAEFHAENHAKLLLEAGDSVFIMTKKNNWLTKGRECIDNIDVFRLHAPVRWMESVIRLLTTHSNTDCIYILGTPKFSVWAILWARYMHKPTTLVLTSKSEIFNKKDGWRYRIFATCDNYIAISREIAHGLIEAGGVSKEKIHILPQGVDTTARFFPVTQELKTLLRKQYNIPVNRPIVLFCARVVPNKGIRIMLKAWEIVHKKSPNAILLVVGGGITDLIDEIKTFGKNCADDSIIVTGEVDRTDDYYKMADVYFFPSEFEGLPTTLMEAIATGLPCVASDIGGNEDLIKPSGAGVLIDKFDFETFAKEILFLLEHEEQRNAYSKCGRRYAEKYLDCHLLFSSLRKILLNDWKDLDE